jgi:hypothetical protein
VGCAYLLHVSKLLQSNGKKTTTATGGAIVLIVSLPYPDMIKKPKKQTNFIIYIR